MDVVISSISDLLTTPPGNLIYQFILIFSILGVFLVKLQAEKPDGLVDNKRVLAGLIGLLLIRLLLSAAGGLILGGILDADLLPALDRGVTALSVVLLIWLWISVSPNRVQDTATVILLVLVAILTLVGTIVWISMGSAQSFNASWLDIAWNLINLGFILLGMLELIRSKPSNWGTGIWMLGILGVGFFLQILIGNRDADFSGIIRLTHLAAFPLLFALPDRRTPVVEEERVSIEQFGEAGRIRYKMEPKALSGFFKLAEQEDFDNLCESIVRVTGYVLVADVCFLIFPSFNPAEKDLLLKCGYNQIQESTIAASMFARESAPLITSVLEKNSPLRLPPNSTALDLITLRGVLGLEQTGYLMAGPIKDTEKNTMAVLCLISPFSDRQWTSDDQGYLMNIASEVGGILQRYFDRSQIDHQLAELEQEKSKAFEEVEALQIENRNLRLTLAELDKQFQAASPSIGDPPAEQIASITAAVDEATPEGYTTNGDQNSTHEIHEFQEMINSLNMENIELQMKLQDITRARDESLDQVSYLRNSDQESRQLISDLQQELEIYKNEISSQGLDPTSLEQNTLTSPDHSIESDDPKQYQAALGEIERLEKLLSQTDLKLGQLGDSGPHSRLTTESWQTIITIAQELRQPMSSIVGYSDFLISESVGLLGSLQHKFLDRVKSSALRMDEMVDNLIHLASLESGMLKLSLGEFNLTKAIDAAIANTQDQLRKRDILLRMEIPDDLPPIEGDSNAIEVTLTHLLQNAGTATPIEGEVSIRVSNDISDGDEIFLEIEIEDSGSGIAEEDREFVFNRRLRSRDEPIQGLGEASIGLSVAKTLVEAHSGRIWIDSTLGQGSIFRILLPLKQETPKSLLSNWSN